MDNPLRAAIGVQRPDELIKWINALFYGEPGAGKTTLLGTALDAEDTSPMLLLDVEGGSVTLRKRKNLDVVKVRSIQEIVDIHNKLYKAIDSPGGIYYKTVGIDSLTELQALDMRTVMEHEKNARPDTIDVDVATQRAWGKSRNRLSRIIRHYKDLPVNTLATCLLGSELDDVNNVWNYYPMLSGKLRGEVSGYFDIVGYLKVDISGDVLTRVLQTTKTKRVVAKDRTDELGSALVNPTIPLMWEKMNKAA